MAFKKNYSASIFNRGRVFGVLLRLAELGVDQLDLGGREGAAREVTEMLKTGIEIQPFL